MIFRFSDPQWLWLLFLIPLFWVLNWQLKSFKQKLGLKHLKLKSLHKLTASFSPQKDQIKMLLRLLVFTCFVFALARPQVGNEKEKIKGEGIELVVLFDVSHSMLAEDIKPSRMEVAKSGLSRFLSQAPQHKVGLIAFAGSGLLLSPMTTDKSALKIYVNSLSPDTVSTQGTEYAKALQAAYETLVGGGGQKKLEEVVTKAILIISDGEDNEKGALDVIEGFVKKGIHIFSVAVGTEAGGVIPLKDRRGVTRSYLKDKSGKVVQTKMQTELLKKMAQLGRGSFYHINYATDVFEQLNNDLKRLEQKEFEEAVIVDYGERYQWILFVGFFFGLGELWMGRRRTGFRLWKGRFEGQTKDV